MTVDDVDGQLGRQFGRRRELHGLPQDSDERCGDGGFPDDRPRIDRALVVVIVAGRRDAGRHVAMV